MPKITINGIEIEVPADINLIEAARTIGVEIPHFCYHPALSIAGNCRMCQVEIEERGRKRIDIACKQNPVEGMIVNVDAPSAVEARRAVMEFLLLSHPLDCPICDDAGECQLQNYYMMHDLKPSRLDIPKLHKHKAQDIGHNIMLDSERCILCSRCVRFTREIAGVDQISIFNSGANSEIGVLPGQKLDNEYDGCVVDVCPVGALTDKDYRFKRRVWYLRRQQSICPGCSRGCNIEIHYDLMNRWKSPQRRIQRLKPLYNKDVNGYWMCNHGRYIYKFVDAPDRPVIPQIRQDNFLVDSSWDETFAWVGAKLKSVLKGEKARKTALLVSPKLSTGALYLLKKLTNDTGLELVEYRMPDVKQGRKDELLRMNDLNPNSKAAEILGLAPKKEGFKLADIIKGIKNKEIRNLIALVCDPAELIGEGYEKVLSQLDFFLLAHWTNTPAQKFAHAFLPLAAFAEENGTYINFEGRLQRYHQAVPPLGEARPAWQVILFLAKQLGLKYKYFSEAELFEDFTKVISQFNNLKWEKVEPILPKTPVRLDSKDWKIVSKIG